MADGLSIPLSWKVGATVFGLLSFAAGIGGVCVYLLNYGENKCVADTKVKNLTAENTNLKKTLENTQNGIQKQQESEDKIRTSGRDNPALGPAMSDSLNELRAEHKSSAGR